MNVKSMKKLLIFSFLSLFSAYSFAQEAAEKTVQAGVVVGLGTSLMNEETNFIDQKGIGFDFVPGVVLDWSFSKNIALSFGLEFDFNRFRYDFNNINGEGDLYVSFRDRTILTKEELEEAIDNSSSFQNFLMENRRNRVNYLTLPTMLKFQTNHMGYMRYFAKFGLRNSFRLRSRADFYGSGFDFSTFSKDETVTELMDMAIPNDVAFYRGTVGMSFGAEWNFAGGTSLVGEIGYYYGFTNVHRGDALTGDDKDRNKTIYHVDGNLNRNYEVANARQRLLMLKVAVLF